MSPKVSIIVPFYNAEAYLPDCIKSIQAQTYSDFEVIFVDDGSTDKSLHAIESLRSTDGRFLLYHQHHRGVSSARNVGLKYATGDFICFVDADDQIAPTYIEDLYNAVDGQVDSSMGGFKKIDLLSHDECVIIPEKKIETLEENFLGFYDAKSTDWQRYLWNRMFKRSIIQQNNIRFEEGIYYKEDGLFVIRYLCASNGLVGCVNKVLYFYKRNATGAMSKTWHSFDNMIITNLDAHRLMIEVIRKKDVSPLVLSKAVSQAKAANIWILQMMWQSKSFHLSLLTRIERIMISILGIREYLAWRVSQLFKLIK